MAAIKSDGPLPEPCKASIGPLDCVRRGFELGADQYWMQFLIAMIGLYFVHAATLGLLTGPYLCTMFIMLFDKMRGRAIVIEHIVRGLDCFWSSLFASLALWGALAVAGAPFALFSTAHLVLLIRKAVTADPSELGADIIVSLVAFGLAMQAAVMLCSLAVYALFVFVFQLIADFNLPALEALKIGVRAAWMNLVEVAALLLLLGLIFFAVSLPTCGLGGLFYLPFAFASLAEAHRKVFPDPEIR